MKRAWCERESELIQSLRTGSCSPVLNAHVQNCAICSETEHLTKRLLQNAIQLRAEHEPPAPDLIWRRAQAQKQRLALKQATRPLKIMRGLSFLYAIGVAVWLLRSFWHTTYEQLVPGWSGTALSGAAVALCVIATGSWYLLREAHRFRETHTSTRSL